MLEKFHRIAAATLFIFSVIPATSRASTITFEAVPGDTPSEGLFIDDQYLASDGVSFSLEGGGLPELAQRGGRVWAFIGPPNDSTSDTVRAESSDLIGDFFLTILGGAFEVPPALIIDYQQPVSAASGVMLDIDGVSSGQPTVGDETWTIQARNASEGVIAQMILDPTSIGAGDGGVTPWVFSFPSAEIHSIRIAYSGDKELVGLAFDNFNTTAIPEPGTALLVGIGLVGLAGRRRRG